MAGRPRKTAAKPTKTLEQQLWDTADALRGNQEPSEYKHVVLSGLSANLGLQSARQGTSGSDGARPHSAIASQCNLTLICRAGAEFPVTTPHWRCPRRRVRKAV